MYRLNIDQFCQMILLSGNYQTQLYYRNTCNFEYFRLRFNNERLTYRESFRMWMSYKLEAVENKSLIMVLYVNVDSTHGHGPPRRGGGRVGGRPLENKKNCFTLWGAFLQLFSPYGGLVIHVGVFLFLMGRGPFCYYFSLWGGFFWSL